MLFSGTKIRLVAAGEYVFQSSLFPNWIIPLQNKITGKDVPFLTVQLSILKTPFAMASDKL